MSNCRRVPLETRSSIPNHGKRRNDFSIAGVRHHIQAFSRKLTRPRTRRRYMFVLNALVVVSMLLMPFYGSMHSSFAAAAATAASATASSQPDEPPRIPVAALPLGDTHLPFLSVDLDVAPFQVAQGDIFTATLTVSNQSTNPAEDLVVSLPLPAGVVKATNSQQGGQSGQAGWTWQQARLAPNETVKLQAPMKLTQPQPGDAIVLEAKASAADLPQPSIKVGGALVINRGAGAQETRSTAQYTPGSRATLRSADGRIQVDVPANASGRPLKLQHDSRRPSNRPVHGSPAYQGGFPPFYLTAIDEQGKDVHQFSAPLTVRVSYTPEQLQALRISETDLVISWYNETAPGGGRWELLKTSVDTKNRVATTQVDHFSEFALSDGSSPSAAFVPSLQGWQVGLYTGNVTYQYPIQVPAGPGGIKPNIALSYNSTATDGRIGTQTPEAKAQGQSSWVGKGWSLDTGYVALNRIPGQKEGRYYTLVFDGQSFDLVRGAPRVASPVLWMPSDWEWHPTDESFIRARAEKISALSGRGGTAGDARESQRYKWQIWTKDGTRYDFEEDAWQGWNGCYPYPDVLDDESASGIEAYKWHLSRVEDTHGNQVTYIYDRNPRLTQPLTICAPSTDYTLNPDYDVWPIEILWGKNINASASADRFRVVFGSSTRGIDTIYDAADNQAGGDSNAPHSTRRLDTITVQSKQAGATDWQRISQYNLVYETDNNKVLLSDYATKISGTWYGDANLKKLTLKNIQRLDKNASTTDAKPPVTFTYSVNTTSNTNAGTDTYPEGGWNRLTGVNNGQGGAITFQYQHIAAALAASANTVEQNAADKFGNNRRVTSRTVSDGFGQSYTWSYAYEKPAYNSLGTSDSSVIEKGPNQWPNSASLVYATYHHQDLLSRSQFLVHQPYTEFRGHRVVTETLPTSTLVNNIPQLNQVEHWFIQGDLPGHGNGIGASCSIPNYTGSSTMLSNSCFVALRNREMLKGREEKTVVHGGNTSQPALSQTDHKFTVAFKSYANDYGDNPTHGLWRAFAFENERIDTISEGSTSSIVKSTLFDYDTNTGNLLKQSERTGTGTSAVLYRETEHSYAATASSDNTRYIIDRSRKDTIKDGTGKIIANTIYGWDGSTGGAPTLTKGELTHARKYFTVQAPFPSNSTASSTDISYGYDTYGNNTTVTTYPNAGVTTYTYTNSQDPTSLSVTYSPPGNCTTPCGSARTTTTAYESHYNALPTSRTRPTVGGVTLVETATYDYRMGTMTSVTDPNGNTTSAEYDTHGRMNKLIKPGDSSTAPTAEFRHDDTEYVTRNGAPVRYVQKIWVTNPDNSRSYRQTLQFYDGMGRLLQNRSTGTTHCEQVVVVDKKYDAFGQATAESTPRYVSTPNGCDATGNYAFSNYSAPPQNGTVQWMSTTYDAQGRSTKVTAPDNTFTTIRYDIGTNTFTGAYMPQVVTTDARGHKTAHVSDIFGRLRQVKEFEANGTTTYATTNYDYSPLDLLTVVTDTNGYKTTMTYDAQGRKTAMQDLTMGSWQYSYNANGKLTSQTDAKAKTINFSYDALDRLTGKTYPTGGGDAVTYYYDQSGVPNGKGRRTSMSRGSWVTNWRYDYRGNQVWADYNIPQLNSTRVITQSYDNGGRLVAINYPGGELVKYTYDAAWRQKSLCSASSPSLPCYASNATYTALDQPTSLTLGNGLVEQTTYNSLMQRLDRLRVGTTSTPGSIMDRTYNYDAVGNVATITNTVDSEVHNFTYDQLNRLTNWTIPNVVNQSYSYDKVGNFTSKVTTTYGYTPGAAQNGGPYAVRTTSNGGSYTYDANGNMLSNGLGLTLTWNTDNLPTQISNGTVTEQYSYDADDGRIARTSGGVTTYYMGGLYEETAPGTDNSTIRIYYAFNGQIIAQREVVNTVTYSEGGGEDPFPCMPLPKQPCPTPAPTATAVATTTTTNTLIYLHREHLGSVSATTSTSGALVSKQQFDPWGKVRTGANPGPVTQTKLNYTGQKLDDTGLLYYNARYYDPSLARFMSPDSIVPGATSGVGGAGGTVGGWQNSRLTVDFHERGFLNSVNEENSLTLQKGFWFQLDGDDKSEMNPSGPGNPQALNRYSYVQNNPLRYVDPTGHYLLVIDVQTGAWSVTFSWREMAWMSAASSATAVFSQFLAAILGIVAAVLATPVAPPPLNILLGILVAEGVTLWSAWFAIWLGTFEDNGTHLQIGCDANGKCGWHDTTEAELAAGNWTDADLNGENIYCVNDPGGRCARICETNANGRCVGPGKPPGPPQGPPGPPRPQPSPRPGPSGRAY